jgi:hypothetical protein
MIMFDYVEYFTFSKEELEYLNAAKNGYLPVIQQFFDGTKTIPNLAISRTWQKNNQDLKYTALGIAARANHTNVVIYILGNLSSFFKGQSYQPSKEEVYQKVFLIATETENMLLIDHLKDKVDNKLSRDSLKKMSDRIGAEFRDNSENRVNKLASPEKLKNISQSPAGKGAFGVVYKCVYVG